MLKVLYEDDEILVVIKPASVESCVRRDGVRENETGGSGFK